MSLALISDAYAHAAQEDRCAPRVQVRIPATLRFSGGHSFPVTLVDLSLGGFAASTTSGAGAGTRCWLNVAQLKGLQAEVVWNDGQTVGCAFANLLNPAVFESVQKGL